MSAAALVRSQVEAARADSKIVSSASEETPIVDCARHIDDERRTAARRALGGDGYPLGG